MLNKNDLKYLQVDTSTLNPGKGLKLESSITLQSEAVNETSMAGLLNMNIQDLHDAFNKSKEKEESVFEHLKEITTACLADWESHAVQTQKIKMAINFLNASAPIHTSNKWVDGEPMKDTGWTKSRSNMVYKMRYSIDHFPKYYHNMEYWRVTWDICLQQPEYAAYDVVKIYGQSDKWFNSKKMAKKYIAGRIKAYDHLFQEVSPVIPQGYAHFFTVSCMLPHGYTAENRNNKSE